MVIRTRSEGETELVGERLAAALGPGSVLGLTGPLGAGKTALVRGLARGLGVEENTVHSPTFLTAAEYHGRHRLIHVDLYRHEETLPDPHWLAELLEGDGIAVVEWFERLGDEAPPQAVVIHIDYGRDEDERVLDISSVTGLGVDLASAGEAS